MSEGNNGVREICLGDDFGDVAVKANGVRVEIHADGSILAHTNGSVDAYTNGPVPAHATDNGGKSFAHRAPKRGTMRGTIYAGISTDRNKPIHASAQDAKAGGHAALKVGDRMADGTIYAGISPDTHNSMYATTDISPLSPEWRRAVEQASSLDDQSRQDWRIPTESELGAIRENLGAPKGKSNAWWFLSRD